MLWSQPPGSRRRTGQAVHTGGHLAADLLPLLRLDVVLGRAAGAVITGQQDHIARFIQVIGASPELRAAYLGMLADFEDSLRVLVARRLGLDPDHGRARLLAAAAVTGYRVGLETWLTQQPQPDLLQLLRDNVTTMVKPLVEA